MKLKIKKSLSLIISFLMILSLTMNINIADIMAAESGNVTYDEGTQTLTIKGHLTSQERQKIKDYINSKNVKIENLKYQTCAYLFSGFDKLENVEIDGLETIDIGGMFRDCNSLKNISIQNFDTSKVTDMSDLFSGCRSLTSVPIENWDVSNVTDMSYMFSLCSSLTSIPVQNWNTSKVTRMNFMFWGCTSLTNLPVENWDVSNVTIMGDIFSDCTSLTTIPVEKWNVSKVKSMSYTFSGCESLTNVPIENWDVSNVTDMSWMFYKCKSLTDIPVGNWDVSKVTNIDLAFYDCTSLTNLPVEKWDVSNVTSMRFLFYRCSALTNLPVENWNVSKVTNMSCMFFYCKSLKSIPVEKWNVSNVTKMDCMFAYNSSLKSIPVQNWNVSNVTDMNAMFVDCGALTSVPVGNWDVSKVTNMSFMFSHCGSLADIQFENWIISDETNTNNIFNECSSLIIIEKEPWCEDYIKKMNRLGLSIYSIKYKLGDENLKDEIRVAAINDEAALNYAGQEIPGYKLLSKSIDNKEITCYYRLPHKVTFKDAEGNVIKEEYVEEGGKAQAPSNPVKESNVRYTYKFEGWDKPFDKVTEDIIVSPVYSEIVNEYDYSIIYRCGDEILDTINGTAEYGSEVNVSAKEFEGYALKSDSKGSMTIKETDNTIYFDYVKTYKVTFYDAYGNVIKEQYVQEGGEAEAPEDPVKEPTVKYTYTFMGWDDFFDEVTFDMEIHPEFSAKINQYKYTVIYRCGDTILDIVESSDNYDKTVKAESKSFDDYKLKDGQDNKLKITENEDNNIIYMEYRKKTLLEKIKDFIDDVIGGK